MTLSINTMNLLNEENEFIQQQPFILNKSAKKINDEKDLVEQFQHLKLHGVRTPLAGNQLKKLKYRDIYLLPVFQQKVLGFYKQKKNNTNNWINENVLSLKETSTYKEITQFPSKREERRVKIQAIRAVYALDLDYAVVKVGVTTGAKPWILSVNPYYSQENKVSKVLDQAVNDFIAKWDRMIKGWKKQVVIGADPEFVLQDQNGKMVLASNYLPKKGMVGCDQIWINRDRNQKPIAELRPVPSDNVRAFIIQLYKSMLFASKKIKNKKIKWLAGAMPIRGYPIGGHIHFSNVQLNSFLLRALDNYLTLTLTMLEDRNGINRRPKYGFLGDFREQFHGGFEYRTPPSWLVSPTITKGVIALSKLIAENYIYLYQHPLENTDVQRAYYEGDKEKLRPIVIELWDELKQLEDFRLYEKYLLPLEKLLAQGYTWKENIDIRKAWRIPPYHKITKS